MELRNATRRIGLRLILRGIDPEVMPDPLTDKRVEGVNFTGLGGRVDECVQEIEDSSGKCKVKKDAVAKCAVRYSTDPDGCVTLDQEEYVKRLRPIARPEFTGSTAKSEATESVTDMSISLRGAPAYAALTLTV